VKTSEIAAMKTLRNIFAAVGIVVAAAAAMFALPEKLRADYDVLSPWLIQFENRFPKIGAYPPGATPLNESSGNVAAAPATATLPATTGVTNWLFGFDINGGGATAASIINCTVTGLVGGTATFSLPIPSGATVGLTPLQERFPEPLPASAVNTAIAVSCPSFGTGNTNASVNAYGFQTANVP